MRMIPDEMLDLVAGGRGRMKPADDQSTVYQTVVVTGMPDQPSLTPPPVDWPEFVTLQVLKTYPHHTTPTPAHCPAGADMDMLRTAADQVGKYLSQMTAQDGKEHGAFIIQDPDGSMHLGPISTGTDDSNVATADVSPGQVIVGWIHDHPEGDGGQLDEKIPSPTDVANAHALIQNNPNIVDPNMMIYITDATGDAQNGQTFEYQSNVNVRAPDGPDISKDYASH